MKKLLIVLATLVAGIAIAQVPLGKTASTGDKTFALEASAASSAEVAAGQMALRKSSNPAVRAFAQKMIEDHSKANSELIRVTGLSGIAIAKSPTPEQQSAAARLDALGGSAFDRAYVALQLEDHRKAVALFNDEATNAVDVDLKSFAAKTVQILEMHLKHVESLARTLGL